MRLICAITGIASKGKLETSKCFQCRLLLESLEGSKSLRILLGLGLGYSYKGKTVRY